jgi:hypothetical protein
MCNYINLQYTCIICIHVYTCIHTHIHTHRNIGRSSRSFEYMRVHNMIIYTSIHVHMYGSTYTQAQAPIHIGSCWSNTRAWIMDNISIVHAFALFFFWISCHVVLKALPKIPCDFVFFVSRERASKMWTGKHWRRFSGLHTTRMNASHATGMYVPILRRRNSVKPTQNQDLANKSSSCVPDVARWHRMELSRHPHGLGYSADLQNSDPLVMMSLSFLCPANVEWAQMCLTMSREKQPIWGNLHGGLQARGLFAHP